MTTVAVTEFTDPGCPFAFSAEPHRWRLRWLFGDQLAWRERMVVLAEQRSDYLDKGFTAERVASSGAGLAARYGMPIIEEVKEDVGATVPACRAVVAARLHAPEQEWLLLRRLRHLNFATTGLLDEPSLIAQAATDVGLDPAALEAWMAEPATEAALREDMRLARSPTPAAVALSSKLAKTPEGGWRYTCPSLEFAGHTVQLSVPGFQSSLAYETALANVAPELDRRDAPSGVTEVLEWAGVPLATAEVAEVCGTSAEQAHDALAASGAHQESVGRSAFWSLTA